MFKSVLAVAVALGAVGFLTQDACAAAGGSFQVVGDVGYHCGNASKGTSVTCSKAGNCFGHVPRGGSRGGSLSSILKGGAAPVGRPAGYGVKGTPPGPKQQSVRAPSAPMGVKPIQGPSPTGPILKGGGKR